MSDIQLKRGQTGSATFALVTVAGAPFNLAGFTVTLCIASRQRFERVAVLDAPTTLGTGKFNFTEADYDKLRPGEYVFEVWATDTGNTLPVFSGTLEVVDVPQLAAP
jgi:hypothetical protein